MTDDTAPQQPIRFPPLPPRKKKPGGRGRWVDPIRVHDDIRYGINNFRSVSPGTADPTDPAEPQPDTTGEVGPTTAPARRGKSRSPRSRRQS